MQSVSCLIVLFISVWIKSTSEWIIAVLMVSTLHWQILFTVKYFEETLEYFVVNYSGKRFLQWVDINWIQQLFTMFQMLQLFGKDHKNLPNFAAVSCQGWTGHSPLFTIDREAHSYMSCTNFYFHSTNTSLLSNIKFQSFGGICTTLWKIWEYAFKGK